MNAETLRHIANIGTDVLGILIGFWVAVGFGLVVRKFLILRAQRRKFTMSTQGSGSQPEEANINAIDAGVLKIYPLQVPQNPTAHASVDTIRVPVKITSRRTTERAVIREANG